MNRKEKIKDLKDQLKHFELIWGPLDEKRNSLLSEIRKFEKSFEVGEKVIYTEDTCGRGCHDVKYECVVTGMTNNGMYNLVDVKGNLHSYIYDGHMKRINQD